MVASKECTKTDPKDAKIPALTTRLSKLERNKTSVLEKFHGGVSKITQTLTNTKVRYSNKSYVEVLNNIESWISK